MERKVLCFGYGGLVILENDYALLIIQKSWYRLFSFHFSYFVK